MIWVNFGVNRFRDSRSWIGIILYFLNCHFDRVEVVGLEVVLRSLFFVPFRARFTVFILPRSFPESRTHEMENSIPYSIRVKTSEIVISFFMIQKYFNALFLSRTIFWIIYFFPLSIEFSKLSIFFEKYLFNVRLFAAARLSKIARANKWFA